MRRSAQFMVLLLLLFSFHSTSAWAAYSFEISNDNGDATFDIWLKTDEAFALGSYTFNFGYDSSELSWIDTYTHTPPTALTADFFGFLTGGDGTITNFNAGGFAAASINTDTLIGSVTFEVLDGAALDGEADFFWAVTTPGFGAEIDGDPVAGTALAVAYGSGIDIGDPAAVPLPAAVWLFGSGLFVLAQLRRRFN